ncbi:hypothetical protein DVH24_039418 [Malus domestica]|uniref:Uncharacterized protein n=1 Tax=Malus domestica TaxID=3750 RepID=A0A498HYL4_MALDO|nr:hypothetical protein DVH24_039418 [Malus domestica]
MHLRRGISLSSVRMLGVLGRFVHTEKVVGSLALSKMKSPTGPHPQVNTQLIGHMMREKFNDPDTVYSSKDVMLDVKTTVKFTISYQTASRAKSVASLNAVHPRIHIPIFPRIVLNLRG